MAEAFITFGITHGDILDFIKVCRLSFAQLHPLQLLFPPLCAGSSWQCSELSWPLVCRQNKITRLAGGGAAEVTNVRTIQGPKRLSSTPV